MVTEFGKDEQPGQSCSRLLSSFDSVVHFDIDTLCTHICHSWWVVAHVIAVLIYYVHVHVTLWAVAQYRTAVAMNNFVFTMMLFHIDCFCVYYFFVYYGVPSVLTNHNLPK